MNHRLLTILTMAALGVATSSAFAQGTAFNYQGSLNDGGNPATGLYDVTFSLYDSSSDGNQQGNTLTNLATAVTNGTFSATLDFGNQFPGAARWLQLGVRTNGAAVFTDLVPRQQILPTPYSVYAGNAGAAATAASVPAASIGSGTAVINISGNATTATSATTAGSATTATTAVNFSGSLAGDVTGTQGATLASANIPRLSGTNMFTGTNTFSGVVNALNANNNLAGTVSGNGGGLTNLNAAGLAGTIADARLSTNVPLLNGTNIFTGTNRFAGVVAATNINNQFTGFFTGNGGGLTNLTVTSTVTNLNGTNLVGTIPDARLSTNVALRAGGNTFNGTQIITNGNVGIGTTTPGYLLQVRAGTNQNLQFRSGPSMGLSSGAAINSANDADTANQPLALSGSQILFLNGNVGIGTTAPATGLDVLGTGTLGQGIADNAVALRVRSTATYGSMIALDATPLSGGDSWQLFSTGGAAGEGTGKFIIRSSATGSEPLTILNNGSVGIATTAPGYPLDVNGAGQFQNNLRLAGNGNPTFQVIATNGSVGELDAGIATTTGNLSLNASPGDSVIRSVSGQLILQHGTGSYALVITDNNTVGIGTALSVNGEITCTAINITSDRNAKEDFTKISPLEVLDKVIQMPITEWQYKKDRDGDPAAARHIGPMAQDFSAAFQIGHDDKHISVVDEGGVALAAIQGLNEKLDNTQKENDQLKQSVNALQAQVQQLMQKLSASGNR